MMKHGGSKYQLKVDIEKFKFRGDALGFQYFLRSVDFELMSSTKASYELTSALLDPTKYLLEDGTDDLPAVYKEMPIPPAPAGEATQTAQHAWATVNNSAMAHNQKKEKIFQVSREAINLHLDSSLTPTWADPAVAHHPRNFMKLMHSRYGTEARTILDARSSYYTFLNIRMLDNETFEQFYLSRFVPQQRLANITDEKQALAVLSRMANDYQECDQCLLPKYTDAITTALREAKDINGFRNQMIAAERINLHHGASESGKHAQESELRFS
jgi:hypothetical protein